MSDSQIRAREGGEPDERPQGMPLVVGMVIGAIVMWGTWTFLNDIGEGAAYLGDSRPLAALAPAKLEVASGDGGPDGAAIYTARCVACHQADGKGLPGVFPPLAGSA